MTRPPTADPYLAGHGDRAWSARHYDLDLTYDLGGNRLRGRASIEVELLEDLGQLVLDLAGLRATKVTVDGRSPKRYAARSGRLVVTLADVARAGERLRLAVTYDGSPRPVVDRHHGDAGWEELTDGVIVAGQPHGAPTWFPCNDRPDDKAPYRIRVTTASDYTVVSNGTLVERRRGGSTTTWTYEQVEPMATYLATVQVGRYDEHVVGEEPVPVRLFLPAGTDVDDDAVAAGFGRQAEMVAAFAELFGPYPFPAYAAVVTDDDLEIPLESQSLSTFGRNLLSEDWGDVRLVAHELAHQWFGNAVTLRRWRDIWLHEGFACYAEWLWSEHDGGCSAEEWARHHHDRLAEADQDLLLADPGPEVMFDDRVYKRGALTLHALRGTVGDATFFDLLRSWVADHAGGSVTTEDFLDHVRAGAGEHAEDAVAVLEAWLRERDLPDLPDLPGVPDPD